MQRIALYGSQYQGLLLWVRIGSLKVTRPQAAWNKAYACRASIRPVYFGRRRQHRRIITMGVSQTSCIVKLTLQNARGDRPVFSCPCAHYGYGPTRRMFSSISSAVRQRYPCYGRAVILYFRLKLRRLLIRRNAGHTVQHIEGEYMAYFARPCRYPRLLASGHAVAIAPYVGSSAKAGILSLSAPYISALCSLPLSRRGVVRARKRNLVQR